MFQTIIYFQPAEEGKYYNIFDNKPIVIFH
jgi:hypothetical protein